MQGVNGKRNESFLQFGVKRPELLCPAGDPDCLQAALRFGADAVYFAGESFGMRAGAKNFKPAALLKGVEDAHRQNVKVYLTCNISPHNSDIKQLPPFLEEAVAAGVDALIISDMGVLKLAKQYAPELPVHISVQAGIVNTQAALAFYEMGATRVVLARELTLEEIHQIRRDTPAQLELEAFVHGAVCVSQSGRCLLSDYMAGRDANRGDCAQPCRWKYSLVEEKRPGQYYPIEEDDQGTHILNANDLCMIKYIPELVNAGIDSFKIEGRAKSAYYTAVTANAYRQAIDLYVEDPVNFKLPDWIYKEILKVSHRNYSAGFYLGRPVKQQTQETAGYIRDFEVVAVVEGYENERLCVTQRNRFFKGDLLDVLVPRGKPVELTAARIFDETGRELQAANHAMQKLQIPYPKPLPEGSMLRKNLINNR